MYARVKRVAHLLNDLDNQTGGLACVDLSDETLRDGTRRARVVETEATNVRVCACGTRKIHKVDRGKEDATGRDI
jgi:hypothetical protein